MAVSTKPNLIRAAEARNSEASFSHPFNPNSLIVGTQVSRLTGLQRTAVSLARIPAGKESFIYHMHHYEEEWLYILSGKGTAEIDGAQYEVGPGDFMGFPTPSVAHHLRNASSEDLVYLMGGESLACEVAEFPKLGKLMIRRGGAPAIYNIADAQPFAPPKG